MDKYNIIMILGWMLLVSSWVPKHFIKNDKLRNTINLILSGAACILFLTSIISLL